MNGSLVRLGASASAALILAACTSLSGLSGSSSYACKAPEGVACDSVSGVYANAVQNNLPSQQRRAAAAPNSPLITSSGAASPAPISAAPSSAALRSSPRILRLWFKPWEDADHDLYDQGYVYVQVDAGQWQIDHVQRQIRDSFAPLKPPPRAADATSKDALPPALDLKGVLRPPVSNPLPTPPGPSPLPNRVDTDE
jgi:conjugal transfer pilus assembly protein TraV